MKCPCCNGTGRTPMVTIVKTDSGLPCDFPCIECDGTGEVEMTNEYFLQTATTEQLAEILCNVGFENETIVRKFKSEWVEWLKQPHKE